MTGRRSTDTGETWVRPNSHVGLAEVFAETNGPSPYVEAPDVPEGMTLPEYRRTRQNGARG